jgi:hypothetical protein
VFEASKAGLAFSFSQLLAHVGDGGKTAPKKGGEK